MKDSKHFFIRSNSFEAELEYWWPVDAVVEGCGPESPSIMFFRLRRLRDSDFAFVARDNTNVSSREFAEVHIDGSVRFDACTNYTLPDGTQHRCGLEVLEWEFEAWKFIYQQAAIVMEVDELDPGDGPQDTRRVE